MSGPGETIRRRIDNLLFERPPAPARLTPAGLGVIRVPGERHTVQGGRDHLGGAPGARPPAGETRTGLGEAACTVGRVIVELGSGHRYDCTTRTLVMGILNRTPDSFWDRGRFWDFDDFLRLAERHVADGADFLDVGGSKAGPGPEVTEAEEMERVLPAVEALHSRFGIPISVDTFRGGVADEAFAAGASVGNDISGFADPTFLPACARHGAAVVATHVRIGPRVPDPTPTYADVVVDVRDFLVARVEMARSAGIPDERIMVDAGLDLGKTPGMSASLLRRTDDLVSIGLPVFLSASNKGFLGDLTGTAIEERMEPSWSAHALGIALGCRIIRSHDVRGGRRVADTMEAVLSARRIEVGASS